MNRRLVRIGLLRGVGTGVVIGLFDLLDGRSLMRALVSGIIIAAIVSTLWMLRLRAERHLVDLPASRQRDVRYTVQRGEAINDQRLAEPVMRHARWTQDAVAYQHRAVMVILWSLLGLSLLAGVARLWSATFSTSLASSFSVAVWVVILVVGPRDERRALENARKAEESARRLLPFPPAATGTSPAWDIRPSPPTDRR